ncbi:putative RNA polymerase II subunit B1 CTD phosphatase RPAP2 isoform X2 [Patella vulgata]|uniref:putative RNA polymerase II subunit B1 CTD phosphatase RPAP2 isoform X2 n=1 Tax=Patella vulgata TaxID=6465 RepID=UPI00217F47B3|nr:putative RNA polymerase II subunit B1 CTD phosphatase RPAP2 isoform X2 [Patella vulgata]
MASTTNPPTCVDEKSKLVDTERNIRNRIALEKQAFHIVENLIETGVKEEYLLEIGNLIGLGHYHDVIEERTIVELCGYPLCDNQLKMIPKQKYHISSKSNKVYDITERKKFCSNQCFKASTFYENQISTSPIWARESERKVEFKLLQPGRGFLGVDVIGSPDPNLTLKAQVEELLKLDSVGSRDKSTEKSNKNIEDVTESLEKVDLNLNNGNLSDAIIDTNSKQTEFSESTSKKYGNSSSIFKESESPEIRESESPEIKEDQLCKINETKTSGFSQKPTESKSDYMIRLLDKRKKLLAKMADDKPLQVTSNDKIPSVLSESLDLTPRNTSGDISSVKTSDKGKKEQKDKILEHDLRGTTLKESELSPLSFICTVIKQWITVKTKDFLMRRGENSDQRDEDFNYKYAVLCQSLERKEQEREKLEEGLMEELDESETRPKKTTKPLPDYKKIEKETKEFEIKVKEFYSGNFYTDKELKESEKCSFQGLARKRLGMKNQVHVKNPWQMETPKSRQNFPHSTLQG